MSTIAIPRQKKEAETYSHPGWRVLLLNDEVNELAMVVYAIQRAAGLSLEVAEMVAMEAHESGSAVVKRGLSEDEAQLMCQALKLYSQIPHLTPGVEALAELDS